MKCLSLLLALLSCMLHSQAQDNKIPWKETARLTWGDFKGKPDLTSGYWAYTGQLINYKYSWDNNGNISVELACYFQKDLSWKREDKKLTPELLEHEQKHFDIAEIFARKMRKAFNEYAATHKHSGNTANELKAIFEKLMNENYKYQDDYDAQTDHSKNAAKQEEWSKKITAELAGLAKYKLD